MPSAFLKYFLFLAVLTMPGISFLFLQHKENISIDNYLVNAGLVGQEVSKQTAIRVAQKIRQDFNTDIEAFEALDIFNRPFLRESTQFLLKHKEGLCGEGTRVLVNVLNRLGFDSTRVTLYDDRLNSAHTLVAVKIDEREFFVDSINSWPSVTRLLEQKDVSTADFALSKYSNSLAERHQFRNHVTAVDGDVKEAFLDKFWLYSYEATPYTKVATKMGMNVRIFNFKRPPRFISGLAEKPYLIVAIIVLGAAIVLFIGCLVLKYWLKRKYQRRTILNEN